MRDDQFGLLVIILVLGFGGAFAGGITLGDVMIGLAIGAVLVLVCFVWGAIDWCSQRTNRDRERAARYRNWLSDARHELWEARRPASPYAWKIKMLTENLQRLECEVGPELQRLETRLTDYSAARPVTFESVVSQPHTREEANAWRELFRRRRRDEL